MANDDVDQEMKGEASPGYSTARIGDNVAVGIDDTAVFPKGQIDPVYEAKARVLNRAVRTGLPAFLLSLTAPICPGTCLPWVR